MQGSEHRRSSGIVASAWFQLGLSESIWIYKKQSPTLYCKHSEIESKHRPLTMKITMTATCTSARAKVGSVVFGPRSNQHNRSHLRHFPSLSVSIKTQVFDVPWFSHGSENKSNNTGNSKRKQSASQLKKEQNRTREWCFLMFFVVQWWNPKTIQNHDDLKAKTESFMPAW